MSGVFAVPRLAVHSLFDNQTYHVTDRLTREQMLAMSWGRDEDTVAIAVTIPIPINTTDNVQDWNFEIIEEGHPTGLFHTMRVHPSPYTSVELSSNYEDVIMRLVLRRGDL